MLTIAHHFEVPLTLAAGNYRARVYGQQMADGRWSGSLVFVPVGGGRLIATERETTQSSLADLKHWATGLSEVYLEGALERGLALQPEAQLAKEIARLEQIEASAEIRADALDRAATAARTRARVAEAARERTEEQLLETIAENAEVEAEAHEQAAAESRTAARAAERALRTKNSTTPMAKEKQKKKKKT